MPTTSFERLIAQWERELGQIDKEISRLTTVRTELERRLVQLRSEMPQKEG